QVLLPEPLPLARRRLRGGPDDRADGQVRPHAGRARRGVPEVPPGEEERARRGRPAGPRHAPRDPAAGGEPRGRARDITVDGFKRIYDDHSWLLFRKSGTEPLIRVYSDAPTKERAEELAAQ